MFTDSTNLSQLMLHAVREVVGVTGRGLDEVVVEVVGGVLPAKCSSIVVKFGGVVGLVVEGVDEEVAAVCTGSYTALAAAEGPSWVRTSVVVETFGV